MCRQALSTEALVGDVGITVALAQCSLHSGSGIYKYCSRIHRRLSHGRRIRSLSELTSGLLIPYGLGSDIIVRRRQRLFDIGTRRRGVTMMPTSLIVAQEPKYELSKKDFDPE